MADWMGWIETAVATGVMALAFLATYEGARRLVSQAFARGPSLMLALGLALAVYEGGASLKIPAQVRLQSLAQSSMKATEPPGGWEKAPVTAAQRTSLSANAAMINYMVTGQIQPFIDAAGQRVPYVPTAQELQAREALVRDQKGAEDTGEQFFERGVNLMTTALVCLLTGGIVGLAQRPRLRRPSRA